MVAVIKRAVEIHHRFSPRATQLMSLLLFLNHADQKGRLAQINTGEGKSLVVAMLAAIHALQGKKVDVVTTSPELSIPEVAKQKGFFAIFNLTVGENSENASKKEVYKRDIVYGTAENFQGDILRTEFSGQDIRGDRGFGIVIVDEVDSMLFDSRTSSVMLSTQTPAMHHLEPILAAAWSQVNKLIRHLVEKDGKTYYITEDFKVQGNDIILFSDTPFQDAVIEIDDKEAFIRKHTEEHLQELLRELKEEERKEWDSYQSKGERLSILMQKLGNTQDSAKKKKWEAEYERLEKEQKQAAWNARYPIIEIPNHLKEFARQQIPYWTEHAIAALCYYQKEKHYDVQNENIVPIDYDNTGVLQHNMVWSDGLAQMLQIKEGLALQSESITNNYISTIGYFKRYGSSLYGLSGTLGNETTRQFFADMYGVDMVIIPPYKVRTIQGNETSIYLCKELPAILLPTEKEWYEAIVRTNLCKVRLGRATLIICKYIEQVKHLEQLFKAQYEAKKIFTYTGQAEFKKHTIDGGEMLIATNISGRGTDLTTTNGVEYHGGMHVCITFLPDKYRVELQNAGRTARQGKAGSAQLVLLDPTPNQSIDYLRAKRDTEEALAIKDAKKDIGKMLFRDQLFNRFCALEQEFFSSATDLGKLWQSHRLESGWSKYAALKLASDTVTGVYQEEIEKKSQELIGELRKKLSQYTAKELIEAGINIEKEEAEIRQKVKQANKEEYFKKAYEQAIFKHFCETNQNYVEPDVMKCFQERKTFTPSRPSLAITRGWGTQERKALEERWGFWLHHNLRIHRASDHQKILEEFDLFAEQIRKDAAAGSLVKNPYFYVRKGNKLLKKKSYTAALAAYDQAIQLDGVFSVNARYNKARALVSEKKNRHSHELAKQELKQARALLASTHKPAILSVHAMTGEGVCKPRLAEHLEHQVNILSEQENHIAGTLQVLKRARKQGWHVEITDKKKLTEVFKDAKVNHEPAIKKAGLNGLKHLFVITEKEPTPWLSICTVALVGLLQIAAGVIIQTCTGLPLGKALIQEGISDLITAAKAAWKGKFSWAEWGIQKAISLVVAVVTAGIVKVKEAFKRTTDNLGKLGIGFGEKGLGLATKQLGLELGKGIAKECANELVNYGLDQLVVKDIEKVIAEKVSREIIEWLDKSSFIQKALALDNEQNNNQWQQLLIQEGMQLLSKQESKWMTFFKGVTKGIASNQIQGASQFFQLAGAATALKDLISYTSEFLTEWEESIQNKYQVTLEQAIQAQENFKEQAAKQESEQKTQSSNQQKVLLTTTPALPDEKHIAILKTGTGVEYTSQVKEADELNIQFVAESKPQEISRQFTEHIAAKLTNGVQSQLIQPVTSGIVNWGIERVTRSATESIENAMAALHHEERVYGLGDQVAKPEEEGKAEQQKDKKTEPSTKEGKQEIDPSIAKGLEAIQSGQEGDITALGGVAKNMQSPIYIYDENGKLYNIVGKGLKGKPISLQHTKNEDGSGHWKIPGDVAPVVTSGSNNCLYDACLAQMSAEQRAQLGVNNGEDLRQKVVETLSKQPKLTKELFSHAQELSWRSKEALLAGGGIYAKTAEKLQSIDAWLAENPNLKILINNMGGIAGGALWIRSLASRDPRGLLAVIAIDQAYEFVVNKIDFTIAQQQLSIYLQSKDKDLTAEQAQYLAKKGLKVAKEVGRFSTHAVTSKGYGLLRKEFGKLLDRKGVFKELSTAGKGGGKLNVEVNQQRSNQPINKIYKSPNQDELLRIWSKQEATFQPLDILGNAKIYGSKGMMKNQFVYDLVFLKGDKVSMTNILLGITQQAKAAGASSIRLNGNAVVNVRLNNLFTTIQKNSGKFMGWRIVGGETPGSTTTLIKNLK